MLRFWKGMSGNREIGKLEKSGNREIGKLEKSGNREIGKFPDLGVSGNREIFLYWKCRWKVKIFEKCTLFKRKFLKINFFKKNQPAAGENFWKNGLLLRKVVILRQKYINKHFPISRFWIVGKSGNFPIWIIGKSVDRDVLKLFWEEA